MNQCEYMDGLNMDLAHAAEEINRLKQQRDELVTDLTEARNALLREGMQRDELFNTLQQIAIGVYKNLGSAQVVAKAVLAKVGADKTGDV